MLSTGGLAVLMIWHVSLAGGVHRSEPGVQIEQRGHDALLILQTHLRGSDLEPRLAIARRDDVIEDVDFHGSRATETQRHENLFVFLSAFVPLLPLRRAVEVSESGSGVGPRET